jgi:hypothetical protein
MDNQHDRKTKNTPDFDSEAPSKQVRTLKVDDHIELRLRWFFGGAWMFIGAAAIWNAIVFGVAISIIWGETNDPLWILSLHILAGVFMGYYALAIIFNETRVFIKDDFLRVVTAPIPTHPMRQFHAHDIARVQVVASGTTIGDKQLYNLMVETRKGDCEKVLGSLNHQSDGLFLKQELEFILGLPPDDNNDVRKKRAE